MWPHPLPHPIPGDLLAQGRRLLGEVKLLTWKPMQRYVIQLVPSWASGAWSWRWDWEMPSYLLPVRKKVVFIVWLPSWLVRICSMGSSLPHLCRLAPALERSAICRCPMQGGRKQEMPAAAEHRCCQVYLPESVVSTGAGVSRGIKWVWSESEKNPIHSTGRQSWLRAWKKSISWEMASQTRVTSAWMQGCEWVNRLHTQEIIEKTESDFKISNC